MGDNLGAPGATGMGWVSEEGQREEDNIETGPNIGGCAVSCPSQVSPCIATKQVGAIILIFKQAGPVKEVSCT